MELDEYQRSELHYAVLEGDADRAAYLASAGFELNAQDINGMTPLHFAAQERAVDVARLLLEAGADPNVADRYGNGPLWTSILGGGPSIQLIELLLSAGANPSHVNNAGRSPIEMAREIGHGLEAPFSHL